MGKSSEWKKYVKEAKKRLAESKRREDGEEILVLNSKRLSSGEIYKLNEIVKEIVASDSFVYDPLGKLTDKEVFDELNDNEKLKYLLDLSVIYLKLREKQCKKL